MLLDDGVSFDRAEEAVATVSGSSSDTPELARRHGCCLNVILETVSDCLGMLMIPPNFLRQEDKAVEFLSGVFQMLGPIGVLIGGFAAGSPAVNQFYRNISVQWVAITSRLKLEETRKSLL